MRSGQEGGWQYDDTGLERLSTMLTLRNIGFTTQELEAYMRPLLEGGASGAQRLRMLEKRSAALESSASKRASSSGWIPPAP